VPIVEPEILMDGDHPIETTAVVQERVLREVYAALAENGVLLEGTLLKPSMTTAGASHGGEQTPQQVGEATVRTLRRTVPAAMPGILFLDAINRASRHAPWNLGFSFGRALQHSCLQQWGGHDLEAGQKALLARARASSEASLGSYRAGSQPSNDESLFVAGYVY
jgi:fructose-bisphosphate aldolase class I